MAVESAAFYPRPDVQWAGIEDQIGIRLVEANRVLRGNPQNRDSALKLGNVYRGLQGVDRKVRDHPPRSGNRSR